MKQKGCAVIGASLSFHITVSNISFDFLEQVVYHNTVKFIMRA